MKFYPFYVIGLLLFCSYNAPTSHELHTNQNNSKLIAQKPTNCFKLSYSYTALGSAYGTMQPTFNVRGTEYIYNLEQNSSFTGKFDAKPEFVCKGHLRISSIDSITNLVKDINDTLIYKTNTGISSGGIHSISIETDNINITFRLHNAYDSTAQKIIDILNTNIPQDKERLWLFNTDMPTDK